MTLQMMRRIGVLAIAVTGAVHLQQYLGDYHSLPTIGPQSMPQSELVHTVTDEIPTPLNRYSSA